MDLLLENRGFSLFMGGLPKAPAESPAVLGNHSE
jgi:hypothetical protein